MSVDLLSPAYIEDFARAQQRPLTRGIDYIPTSWPAWNKCCRDDGGGMGLAMGWHVIGAASTGMGKSVMALNLAAAAIQAGATVGFVSLEMGETQIAARLYGILTATPVSDFERGRTFRPDSTTELAEFSAERPLNAPTFLVADGAYEISAILGQMDEMKERGASVFIVDYMQLADCRDEQTVERTVTAVSREVRRFAKQHSVLTFGLSQFNRSTSSTTTEPPRVQGLFGASGLENDADQVVMVDHSRFEVSLEGRGARTHLILGKNRHGPVGEIPLWVDYSTLRWREAQPDEVDEWPT